MSNAMNTEDVKKLAQLARLSVPEMELQSVAQDIGTILGFIDTIQSVQLESIVDHNPERANILRDDAVQPLVPEHDLVEAAPQHQDHFVKVPKVLE